MEHGAHYLLTVKGNRPHIETEHRHRRACAHGGFPPAEASRTDGRTIEKNSGKREIRTLIGRQVSAEDIGFPFAAQVGRVLRQRDGRKDEEVELITNLEPEELSAAQVLLANRWGGRSKMQATTG
jgi:hypothetical protein